MNNQCSICLSKKIKFLKFPLAKLCLACNHSELIEISATAVDYTLKNNRNFNQKIEKKKNNARAKILIQHGWSGGKVLEIGCAEGRLANFLLNKKIKPPLSLIGIEPSIDKVVAKTIFNKMYSNLRDLPKGKFDLIYTFHVLEHIKNPYEELKLIHRLLGPEGTFVIEVPNRSGSMFAVRDFNPEHIHSFSISSISLLLEKTGFFIESIKCGSYESPVYDNGILMICKLKMEPELRILESFKKYHLMKNPLIIAGLGNDFKKFIKPIIKKIKISGVYDKNPKNVLRGYRRISFEELNKFKGTVLISSFSSGKAIKNDVVQILKSNKNVRIVELQELLGA
jgi:SAM-dependent methyltransferase